MEETKLDSETLAKFLRLGDLTVPLAIRTASAMGLANYFEEGGATADVLAERTSVRSEPLKRLLRVLVAAGVLTREESGTFQLTDIGRLLRHDHPLSMRDAFSIAMTEIRAWSQLEYCIQTGGSGFERSYGETHRSYRSRHLEEDRRMDRAHQAATRIELLTLARAYPWREARTIVDVGGGTGTFLCGLLQRFPDLKGTLFDLPRMIANAGDVVNKYGVAERCVLAAGDFFGEIPGNADIYILKAVVGGWADDDCISILTNIGRAMRADSRLLIIEPVMGAGKEFSRGNVVQLQSFVLYGGKDRTLDDYSRLAGLAALKIQQFLPRSTLPIIELVLK